jgi:NADPH:quinone reductase-like Zn-dependent oxidoreductase
METKGKGCNVILNTVNGPDICSSIHCLAAHGRFVQLVQADLTRNKSMGKKNITICIQILNFNEMVGLYFEESYLEFSEY